MRPFLLLLGVTNLTSLQESELLSLSSVAFGGGGVGGDGRAVGVTGSLIGTGGELELVSRQ